jgi:glycosyltransferase involved in cell wall biosynthesis
MVGLTVLFATLNGAHTLPRMLDTLSRLEPPVGSWKVVAVDNGSTDGSLKILKKRAAEIPMTVVCEARRGKNVALNTGMAFCEGDLVVLTDDDVILPSNWLVGIQRLAEQKTDYDIFGGAIFPVWETPPPEWVLRRVPKAWLGWTDFLDGPVVSSAIWGGNMAVRTVVFRRHKFTESIGPDGSTTYAKGSETEFTWRAEKSGHRCWHFHNPAVGHIIREYQLTADWLLQRAYNMGRGDRRKLCLQCGLRKRDIVASLIGYPSCLSPSFLKAASNVVVSRLIGDSDDQFKKISQLRYVQGDLAERHGLSKLRRTTAGRRFIEPSRRH